MTGWGWVLVVLVVVVVVVLVAALARRQRSASLRQTFGSEYDRTVESRESRRDAEADLRARTRERRQLDIRPLPEATRLRFATEWRAIQERFVDEPSTAVVGAGVLVRQVMEQRGYPMSDFDKQSELISVDHPEVVENYRVAYGIGERAASGSGSVSTEDLREALLRYRSLFDELLVPDMDGHPATEPSSGNTPNWSTAPGTPRVSASTEDPGERGWS